MPWLRPILLSSILMLCRVQSGALITVHKFGNIYNSSSSPDVTTINSIIKEMSCFCKIIYVIESCSSNCYDQSHAINEIIRNDNNSASFKIERYSVITANDSQQRYANIIFIDSYNSFR